MNFVCIEKTAQNNILKKLYSTAGNIKYLQFTKNYENIIYI